MLLSGTGVVGPYLIGAVKSKYGGYTVPMVIMAVINSLAVLYFAVLLRFLPAKAGGEGFGELSCGFLLARALLVVWLHI